MSAASVCCIDVKGQFSTYLFIYLLYLYTTKVKRAKAKLEVHAFCSAHE